MKLLKIIVASAIVVAGLMILGALGYLFIYALVGAFIDGFPASLYAVPATLLFIAAVIAFVLLASWAWDNRWKP